jgi:hypothetical protein
MACQSATNSVENVSARPSNAGISEIRQNSPHCLSVNHSEAGFSRGLLIATPPVRRKYHSAGSISFFPIKIYEELFCENDTILANLNAEQERKEKLVFFKQRSTHIFVQ